jgi:hypothetical protein
MKGCFALSRPKSQGPARNCARRLPPCYTDGVGVIHHWLLSITLPSREAAILWAAKIARACRCSQELREFGYDPES